MFLLSDQGEEVSGNVRCAVHLLNHFYWDGIYHDGRKEFQPLQPLRVDVCGWKRVAGEAA